MKLDLKHEFIHSTIKVVTENKTFLNKRKPDHYFMHINISASSIYKSSIKFLAKPRYCVIKNLKQNILREVN